MSNATAAALALLWAVVDTVVAEFPNGQVVIADGNSNGWDQNTMLGSETFLGQFQIVDQVSTTPAYLPDFTLTCTFRDIVNAMPPG